MTALLLVDADADRRRDIRKSLQTHADWDLIEASSAQEGRKAFGAHAIDLVILELQSAGSPVEELFEWIRSDQSRIPVVLLTPDDVDDQSRVDALVMGAASYVPQSFVAKDMVVTIERILSLSGCHRRHARLADGLVSAQTSFCIEDNDLTMIPVLIGHLVDTADEFGVTTAKTRVQLAIALEEALTNSIVHGNLNISSKIKDAGGSAFQDVLKKRQSDPKYSSRVVQIRGSFERGICRTTIMDEGQGFDPGKVADPTHPDNIERPHGRGLFLIRAFMDEVTFNETGTEIHLVKRAKSR